MENKECQIEYSRYDGYDQITDGNGEIVGFVDKSTGEVLDTQKESYMDMPQGTLLLTPLEQQRRKEYFSRDERRVMRRTDHFKLGEFVMATCRKNQFDTITPKDTARLVYLATYMNEKGILVKGRNSQAFIRRSDLPELLSVSRSTVFHFWNAVKDRFIVELPTGELQILDCFLKGKQRKINERVTKVFVENIRRLYRLTPTSQHVHLGYFFQVLYYINIDYNILCNMDDLDDAKEENIKRIRPMTIQQFCEKIGYDASNAHRLRKACEALCFECDGRIQHLCAFVTNSTYIKGEYLILNPHIIYGGKDYRVVESLGFLFE